MKDVAQIVLPSSCVCARPGKLYVENVTNSHSCFRPSRD